MKQIPQLSIDVNGIQTVTYEGINLSKVCSEIVVKQDAENAHAGFAEVTMKMLVRTVAEGHVWLKSKD